MHEVFRDWDSAKVGLVDQLLKSEGFHTVLRNWTGSNITEVPIPDMFPNVCVLNHEDFVRARKIVTDYFHAQPQASEEWECPKCQGESGRSVFGVLVLPSSPRRRELTLWSLSCRLVLQFPDPFAVWAGQGEIVQVRPTNPSVTLGQGSFCPLG